MAAEPLAEPVFRAVLIGAKLGIFLMFLVYVYMADRASDQNDLTWFYLTAGSLAALAVVELLYILTQIDPALALITGTGEFRTVRLASVIAYTTAGIGGALYLRNFRATLDR